MAQEKPLETKPSVNYDTQQGGGKPPTPQTKRHPNAVQYSGEQQQQSQDAAGN